MNLLLDTHAVLWFWWNDPQLSRSAAQAISDPANRKLVSIASCWEVAIKTSLKKLNIGMPYRDFMRQQMAQNNFELLPITYEHLAAVAGLPFHHRDPFDRLLVAQSLEEKIPIISADAHLDAYAIQRLW